LVKRSKAGYNRKVRDSGRRKIKHVLLIAAEGNNKTETNYFRNFQRDNVSIKTISGNETSPVQLADRLIHEANDLDLQEDDLAVCLVDSDFDSAKDIQLKQADQKLEKACKKQRMLKMILSNPCFEKWYLCHFSSSSRNYNSSKELLKELESYIPGYRKSDNVYPLYLKGKTQKAIDNAKKLENTRLNSGLQPHTVAFGPSTEIYKIFEEFLLKWLDNVD